MPIPRISSRSGRFATTATWSIRRSRRKPTAKFRTINWSRLINYDVSNVDNLYLPLAMEATDVWVVPQKSGQRPPNPNRTGGAAAGSDPDVYGWTGAINTIDFLQTQIREFTADNNTAPGAVFRRQRLAALLQHPGNPTNDPNAPIKIPSGANVFAQSPIKAVPSSYGDGEWQNNKYMLSSGGTQPISATIGWAGGTPDPRGQAPSCTSNRAGEPERSTFWRRVTSSRACRRTSSPTAQSHST